MEDYLVIDGENWLYAYSGLYIDFYDEDGNLEFSIPHSFFKEGGLRSAIIAYKIGLRDGILQGEESKLKEIRKALNLE